MGTNTIASPKEPRLGVVRLPQHVVDLDQPEMVARAKEALFDDICQWFKYNELHEMVDAHEHASLSVDDIPEFLLENNEFDDSTNDDQTDSESGASQNFADTGSS